jgi:hypothetical protein
MDRNIVLIKTVKGRDAIKTNSREISLNERRILIMIDGRRSVGELLAGTTVFRDVEATIESLYRSGYVARADGADPDVLGGRSVGGSPAGSVLSKDARIVIEQELVELLGPIAALLCEEALPAARSVEDALLVLSKHLDVEQGNQYRHSVLARLDPG